MDGYNVMHALPVSHEWPGRTFQDRRNSFLGRVAAYAAGRTHRITVVFDGGRGGDEMGGADRVGGVEVVYSARGTDADSVIVGMLESARAPHGVLVVTSDKSLGGRVRALGASTARADELVRRIGPPGRSPASPDPAEVFERRVKGFVPQVPRRSPRASRSPLKLW